MVKLFCINLKSRKDRLDRFIKINKNKLLQDIEIIEAVDGKKINISEIINKINPLDYLTSKNLLHGVIGCCSSHFSVLQKMIDENIEYAIIMEDDLLLTNSLDEINKPNGLIDVFKNIKGDLLYFNFPYPKEIYQKFNDTNKYILKPFDGKLYTAEMYLISKSFAKKVLDNFNNKIGAFDLILNKTIAREKCKVFCLDPPIADQFDRTDSNIR